jgi:hypothetical protein
MWKEIAMKDLKAKVIWGGCIKICTTSKYTGCPLLVISLMHLWRQITAMGLSSI